MKTSAFLLLFACLFGAQWAHSQTTFLVNPGESIQDAINLAKNGDTVQVAGGTYDESLFINKSIVLLGEGPYETVITGGDNGSVAYNQNRSVLIFGPVVMDGFGIKQDSRAVDDNHNTMGILLEATGGSVIRNCRIENHITGIYVSGSQNNTIKDNVIEYCGNGVLFAGYLYDSDDNTIEDNLIRRNGKADEDEDAGIKLIPNYVGEGNVITSNDIVENPIGVNNQTTNFIDAQGNWWGSASGPNNNSSNPDGEGNSVSNFVIYGNWSVTVQNEILSVEDQVSEKLGAVKLFPNPATGRTTLAYELSEHALVGIRIIDLQGRQAAATAAQELSSGTYETNLDLSGLDAGFYLVELNIDGDRNISRLVLE